MAREYPKDKIDQLLDRYVEEKKVKIVNKRPFAEYVTELFSEGELSWLEKPIPEYFWRKANYKGFHYIEKYNEAVSTPILIENKSSNLKLPSIKDSIEKIKDPQKLYKTLGPYEKELKALLETQKKSEKKIKELNNKLLEQKQKIAELEEFSKIAQNTIYQLFYYSKKREEKNLINLVTTTSNMTKPVKLALENMFNHSAFEYLNTESDKVTEESNVIQINQLKKESASLELWDDL